jgi:hypothetical protein
MCIIIVIIKLLFRSYLYTSLAAECCILVPDLVAVLFLELSLLLLLWLYADLMRLKSF